MDISPYITVTNSSIIYTIYIYKCPYKIFDTIVWTWININKRARECKKWCINKNKMYMINKKIKMYYK